MSRYDVIALGMATVDFIGVVPHLPKADEVFALNHFEVQGGGPAATAIVTLAKLGGRGGFMGVTSQDTWGELIAQDLNRYKVDTHYLTRTSEGHPSKSIILVEATTGKRSIMYSKGTTRHLSPDEVPHEAIAPARILHLDGFHLEAAIKAAHLARVAGTLVSFDGGAGDPWPGIEELLPLVDIMIVARQFATRITGTAEPEQAGIQLASHGAQQVVITDGANGAWYRTDKISGHQPAFQVKVVDTTGAGDTFHGAYLYALLQGGSVADCVRFASAAAALKCQEVGGRSGIPVRSQVEAFLKQLA